MTLRPHLVIFARAPRLGTVKRRLARDVGALAAWRFHRNTTDALLRRLGHDPRWTTWLAVTPDRWARHGRGLWRTPARRLAQGPGDLGARMGRVLACLPPGPVVIVGCDIPGITAAAVARAFKRLGDHDWVLGPAGDGGYWLIGARRRPVLRLPFAGVRWGSSLARTDTLANIRGGKVALLEQLDDIDTGADLARLNRSKRCLTPFLAGPGKWQDDQYVARIYSKRCLTPFRTRLISRRCSGAPSGGA